MSMPPPPASLLAPLAGAADAIAQWVSRTPPPTWLRDELLQRVVLLLNHVLQQEPQAMARLARLKGQSVSLQWQGLAVQLSFTPAGLLDTVREARTPDLRIDLVGERPSEWLHDWASGQKPHLSIHGDVRLAAEVNWLIDHVRWDIEGDLARLVGDVAAYRLAQWAREGLQALRRFAPTPAAGPTGASS